MKNTNKRVLITAILLTAIFGIIHSQQIITRPSKAKTKKELTRQPATTSKIKVTPELKTEATDDSIRAENLRNTPWHLDFELQLKSGDTKYISKNEMIKATRELKEGSIIKGIAVAEGNEIFVITSFGDQPLKYKEATKQSPVDHLPSANQTLAIVRNQEALATAFADARKSNSTGWELDLPGKEDIGSNLKFWISSLDERGLSCSIKNNEYSINSGGYNETLPFLTIGKVYSNDSSERGPENSMNLDLTFRNKSTNKIVCMTSEEWERFKQFHPSSIRPSNGLFDPIGIFIKGNGQDFMVALYGNDGKYEWNLVKSDPNVPTKQQTDLILSNLHTIDRITSQAFGFKFSDKNKSWYWTRSVEKSGGDKSMRVWMFNPNLITSEGKTVYGKNEDTGKKGFLTYDILKVFAKDQIR